MSSRSCSRRRRLRSRSRRRRRGGSYRSSSRYCCSCCGPRVNPRKVEHGFRRIRARIPYILYLKGMRVRMFQLLASTI